ncbi:MAG: DNA-binding protein [Erysipelotrichaceae bacterium]|nr:DNA-binding protein [Erysipelotrichaceae bacterium]
MRYTRKDDIIVARIDRGEEIVEEVKKIAEAEDITFGYMNAIAAIDDFCVCVYSVEEKKFYDHNYNGPYEVVSLGGPINKMNGQPYVHFHLSAASAEGNVVGGHLKYARVSGTCEMFIVLKDIPVTRVYDEKTGLNIFDIE